MVGPLAIEADKKRTIAGENRYVERIKLLPILKGRVQDQPISPRLVTYRRVDFAGHMYQHPDRIGGFACVAS